MSNIKQTTNNYETICRTILESVYNKPFNKIRPDFLKNPLTKENLELDCYNEDLKLALEFNGKQHYFFTSEYHEKDKDLFYQKCKDDYKKIACKNNGIKLLVITESTDKDISINILSRLPRCYSCNQFIGNTGKLCINCKNKPKEETIANNSRCSCGKIIGKKKDGTYFNN